MTRRIITSMVITSRSTPNLLPLFDALERLAKRPRPLLSRTHRPGELRKDPRTLRAWVGQQTTQTQHRTLPETSLT